MQSTEPEIWKPVVGWERYYEVSSMGRVRRIGKDKRRGVKRWVLKPSIFSGGYPGVTLHADGVRKSATVHSLIAAAFNLGDGPVVRHLNGDPADNRIENLVRGSYSENMRDAVRHGTYRNKYTGSDACSRGHKYVEGSYRIRLRGHGVERVCKICRREDARKYKQRKKENGIR